MRPHIRRRADFSPAGYVADFASISEFLAGNVSTEELFRGKAFRRQIAPRTLAVLIEQKRGAPRKLDAANDLMRAQSNALARTARRCLRAFPGSA